MFFFNDTATTEIYTLSLHAALPIWRLLGETATGTIAGGATDDEPLRDETPVQPTVEPNNFDLQPNSVQPERSPVTPQRSEEHTSELQSRQYLVCRLLLEKKTIACLS